LICLYSLYPVSRPMRVREGKKKTREGKGPGWRPAKGSTRFERDSGTGREIKKKARTASFCIVLTVRKREERSKRRGNDPSSTALTGVIIPPKRGMKEKERGKRFVRYRNYTDYFGILAEKRRKKKE